MEALSIPNNLFHKGKEIFCQTKKRDPITHQDVCEEKQNQPKNETKPARMVSEREPAWKGQELLRDLVGVRSLSSPDGIGGCKKGFPLHIMGKNDLNFLERFVPLRGGYYGTEDGESGDSGGM